MPLVPSVPIIFKMFTKSESIISSPLLPPPPLSLLPPPPVAWKLAVVLLQLEPAVLTTLRDKAQQRVLNYKHSK